MDKQMTMSAFSDELANVRTHKKEFLAQIERIVPWGEWIALIKPHYYKGERGNKPYVTCVTIRHGKKSLSVGACALKPNAEIVQLIAVSVHHLLESLR